MIELSCIAVTEEQNPNAFHYSTWRGAGWKKCRVAVAHSCRVPVSVIFFNLSKNSPPPFKKHLMHMPTPTVTQVWGGLEQVGCRWKASRTPLRKVAVMRVMEKDGEKGSRELKWGSRDRAMMSLWLILLTGNHAELIVLITFLGSRGDLGLHLVSLLF